MNPRWPGANALLTALVLLSRASAAPQHPIPGSAGADQFQNSIQPFLSKNCSACHNDKLKTGDVSLTGLKSKDSVAADPELWEKVATKLRDGTMPPKMMPRPAQDDTDAVVTWIKAELSRAELASKPDPGRVTARRLNRTEYNNTVRDLTGIDFRPADDFPQDDSGYGFDNIGDVLSMSPVLLEKYLKAANTIVRTATYGPGKLKPTVLRSQPPGREFTLIPKALANYDLTGLSMPNALHATMRFPADGDYDLRVALEGRRPNGSEPIHIGVWIDGKQISTLDIDAPSDGGSIDLFGAQKDFRTHISAGDHWVAASLLKLFEGLPASYGGPNPTTRPIPSPPDFSRFLKIPPGATPAQIDDLKKRAAERIELNKVPANRVWVHWVEATGPFNPPASSALETRKGIFICPAQEPGCDRKILSAFARKAFRRPVAPVELQPYLDLASAQRKNGSSFDEAVGAALQAVLVSPDFLFRIERDEKAPIVDGGRPIDQYSLASRLSYFLWSSMPDDQLLRCAEQHTLRNPQVLATQIQRMLKDKRAHTLVENFAGQWLELRRLESVAPDREKFPQFDDYLRMSMRQETETFFQNLIGNDLSILELLDAKYTFLNRKLAEFYGITGVEGAEFRKVDLTGTPRAGVMTQASVLTVSSYATRTSPVLRGKWILENLLNEPIPPPPPDVPALDEAKIGAAGSMRHQMEEHRTNPVCASCHSKMDPLGFGFENFNAIGQWRTEDGKFHIDASGTLPDGRVFNGPSELEMLLRKDKAAFAECVTDKLLTYALGRGLERYDKRTVRDIAKRIESDNYRFSKLVIEIVNSLPFQMRRGEPNKS
jgi:mono/diheme cytochrome c family protein